jgi:hypothetical protein
VRSAMVPRGKAIFASPPDRFAMENENYAAARWSSATPRYRYLLHGRLPARRMDRAACGTKRIRRDCRNMSRRIWRAVNARLRRYHRQLLNEVPQELVAVLSRLVTLESSAEAPKIDRMRPGGTPHVRMRSDDRHKRR